MKKLLTLIALCIPMLLRAQVTLDETFPETDGNVYAIAKDKARNILYIGGFFSWVGRQTNNMALVDGSTGAVDFSFPSANKYVTCSAPDGNGGWYVGGVFTRIGGVQRNYLAHIDANNKLTGWNPAPMAL